MSRVMSRSLETSIFDAEIHNLRLFLQNYCSRHLTTSSDSNLQARFEVLS